MLANPFAFLRGAAAIMASDLSRSSVSGTQVAACGDAHVKNFGVYASAERNLVFSINDFDEVYVGPWEWDLKRLAASAVVAAQFLGGDKAQSEQPARECVRFYRKRICRYAEMGYLQVWYDRIDERAVLDSLAPKTRHIAYNVIDKVQVRGHIRALEKLTEQVNGQYRFIEDVPLIVRERRSESGTPIKLMLDRFLHAYIDSLDYDRKLLLSRYQIVDVARKVVLSEVSVPVVGCFCYRASTITTRCFSRSRKPRLLCSRHMSRSNCPLITKVTGLFLVSASHRVHRTFSWVGERLIASNSIFVSWQT